MNEIRLIYGLATMQGSQVLKIQIRHREEIMEGEDGEVIRKVRQGR